MAKIIKESEIVLPQGTTAKIDGYVLSISGPKGEVVKDLKNPLVKITIKDNIIKLVKKDVSRREKKVANTFTAHINNMIKGATKGFVYKLKICSGHFPMNVSVKDNDFVIKNFLGEKKDRKAKLKPGATVKIAGFDITIEGTDIEKVGQAAADIESLTVVKKRDRNKFQDGIYIIEKAGKPIRGL